MTTYSSGSPTAPEKGPGDYSGYSAPKYWHLTPTGEVRQCKAKKKCPYGDVPHTSAKNMQAAQSHFQDVIAKEQVKNVNTMRLGNAYGDNAVVSARDIASKGARLQEALDSPADAVEIIGTVQINDDHPVITIKRKIVGKGMGQHAQWELSRELSNGQVYTRTLPVIDDLIGKDLKSFFTGEAGIDNKAIVEALDIPGYGRDQTYEAYNELRFRIREIARTVENEVELSPVKSAVAHPSGSLSHLKKDAEGKIASKIDFNASGFRPEHLRNVDTGEEEISSASMFDPRGERNEYWENMARKDLEEREKFGYLEYKSYEGLGKDFEVYEKSAGDGAASWKMSQNEDGTWTIKLRGTRGDTQTIVTDSPEEAEAHASSFFSRRIRKRNLTALAKKSGQMSAEINPNVQDKDGNSHRKNRVSFMARMIGEGNLLAMRTEAHREQLVAAREKMASYSGKPGQHSAKDSRQGFFGRKRS